MLRLADIQSDDLLYDLGCGDGRIVVAAAKNYGIRAIGIDIDPIRISESEKNAKENGVTGKVKFLNQNLFEADFTDATVITMYLLTSVNRRLRPKLLSDLKPGTRLVSHRFDMGEWEADNTSTVKVYETDERMVYYWIVPANVTGRWNWTLPDGPTTRRYILETDQKFQVLEGAVTMGGFPVPIKDVELVGDSVRFSLEDDLNGRKTVYLYEGKVKGHTITGTVRPANDPKAKPVNWSARRDPATAVALDTESDGYWYN